MGRAVQSRRPEKETRTWHCNCHGKKYKLGGSPNVECLIRVVAAPVRHLKFISFRNMKDKISINQKVVAEHGLLGKLDLIDLALFDFIYHFFNCNFDKKITFIQDGIEYTEIRYSMIQKQMPLLNIGTKRTLINRINKLIAAGLIERYENNGTENRCGYKRGKNFGMFEFSSPMKENDHPVKTNSHPCENDFTPPVKMISHNKEDKEINKINYNSSIPPTPYQRGAGGDEEEYRYSGSPLPCGAEDRSGRASDAPKRKVAPKEKGEPWRESFDEYMKLVNEGAAALMADAKFRAEVEQLQPNVDYDRTIKWCVSQYWGTEQAWERKRRARTKKIDMKATLRQNFDKNRIYKERRASYSGGSRPRDVDTLHVNDDWAEILAEQERRISDEN